MTDIQVKYWTVEESKRHNSATEAQARNELAETGRHNLVAEAQNKRNIDENVRHNKKTEQLSSKQLRETKRHNIVSENVSKRSNEIANKRADAEVALNQSRTESQQWQNEWRKKNPSLASLKEAGLVSNEKKFTTALTSGALGIDAAKALGDSVPDDRVIKDSDIIKAAEQGVKDGTIIRISEGNGKVTYVAPFLHDSKGRTIKATFRKKG